MHERYFGQQLYATYLHYMVALVVYDDAWPAYPSIGKVLFDDSNLKNLVRPGATHFELQ